MLRFVCFIITSMFLLSQFQSIRIFVFDMDGVLTDGYVSVAEGEWTRRMNVKDGYALQLAVKMGYRVAVISGSQSKPVEARLQKLGIRDVMMNVTCKEDFLNEWVAAEKLSFEEMLFMGDDVPDYACMKMAAIAACPQDACTDVKSIAHYVSPINGGAGCVRDVVEKVLKLNHHWPLTTSLTSQ